MSLEEEYTFVRHSAALSRMEHVQCVRIEGEDATEAVDAICSGDLWVRDGRMRQTLILDERGQPIADVYVCPDDDACILLFEGMTASELFEYIDRYADPELEIRPVDLRPTHELISLHGPYAWEVLSRWLTPDIIGLPYLSFYYFDHGICFRAGKTGEYGYDLLVHREHAGDAWQDLLGLVSAVRGGEVSLETLDLCALENGFFSVRHGSVDGLTPLELQLQWRVSARKRFPGIEAIEERRAEGVRRRLTHFVARDGVRAGDEVCSADGPVGRVGSAMLSPGVGGIVGTALLDISVAHPGIDAFSRATRTRSAPSGRFRARRCSIAACSSIPTGIPTRRGTGRWTPLCGRGRPHEALRGSSSAGDRSVARARAGHGASACERGGLGLRGLPESTRRGRRLRRSVRGVWRRCFTACPRAQGRSLRPRGHRGAAATRRVGEQRSNPSRSVLSAPVRRR